MLKCREAAGLSLDPPPPIARPTVSRGWAAFLVPGLARFASGESASSIGALSLISPQVPARKVVGSTGVEPLRSSKWSWGELTLPLWPDLAIIWPRFTVSPRFTSISPLLA